MIAFGKTTDGRSCVGGVYSFYETHGLPLSDIFDGLYSLNSIPDWLMLLSDMVRAGRPFPRAVEAICSAVRDSTYPPEFKDVVCERLGALKEKKR